MSYEAASNALVAVVGFYTGGLTDYDQKLKAANAKVVELSKRTAEVVAANVKLTDEEAAARRVLEVLRVYLEDAALNELNGSVGGVDKTAVAKALADYDARA
jgi:hypothetical protein